MAKAVRKGSARKRAETSKSPARTNPRRTSIWSRGRSADGGCHQAAGWPAWPPGSWRLTSSGNMWPSKRGTERQTGDRSDGSTCEDALGGVCGLIGPGPRCGSGVGCRCSRSVSHDTIYIRLALGLALSTGWGARSPISPWNRPMPAIPKERSLCQPVDDLTDLKKSRPLPQALQPIPHGGGR